MIILNRIRGYLLPLGYLESQLLDSHQGLRRIVELHLMYCGQCLGLQTNCRASRLPSQRSSSGTMPGGGRVRGGPGKSGAR